MFAPNASVCASYDLPFRRTVTDSCAFIVFWFDQDPRHYKAGGAQRAAQSLTPLIRARKAIRSQKRSALKLEQDWSGCHESSPKRAGIEVDELVGLSHLVHLVMPERAALCTRSEKEHGIAASSSQYS